MSLLGQNFGLIIISVIVIVGSASWIYYDAKKFQKFGVSTRPKLFFVLVLISSFILWIIRDMLLLLLLFRGINMRFFSPLYVYSIPASFFSLLFPAIPLLIYLLIFRPKYQKTVALGNPPLPPAARWPSWLRLIVIAIVTIVISFIILVFGVVISSRLF